MSTFRSLGVAALYVVSIALVGGTAQAAPPPDNEHLDLLLFEPALGAHSFLTVSAADTMSKKQLQLEVGVGFMTKPLSVYVVDKSNMNALTTRAEVIDSMLTGYVGVAYGLWDNVQAGVLLPVVFSMSGQGLDAATGMPQAGGLSVSGLGDARLEVNWRVYDKNQMVLSVIPALTVPTSMKLGSDQSTFLGDELPTFRPRVAWEWMPNAPWAAGVNVGVIIRDPHTVYSSDVGQQLTYGIAAAYHVTRRLDAIGELFGRKGFSLDSDESPLEIDAALRLAPTGALAVQFGGGVGVIKGVGVPGARLFASISWAPDYGDADGDGIPNQNDKCPNQAEDKDGFQDEDGCPDLDNDGDGIPDAEDKCPNEKEDFDGFQDDDGCPDLDNDKDGIPDDKDACPNEPEDHLPPRPDDGCPKGKGLGEDEAVTPAAPAPAATPTPAQTPVAGSAIADRDHDGIPDADDKCPDQPETVNGVNDDDGCPDSGGHVLARIADNEIAFVSPIEFDDARVRTSSRAALDQAALLMRAQAHLIGKWRVIAVPAKKQRVDGAAQAEAVKAYLVAHKVDAGAIETAGGAGAPGVRIRGIAKPDGSPLADPSEPTIEIEPPKE
jgi:hypothetical protein